MEWKPCTNGKINHGYGIEIDAPDAMKLVSPTITEAMAKVTHKEDSGWEINTKETRYIAFMWQWHFE